MMELFTSPSSVKSPAIAMLASARGELYPSRDVAIPRAAITMNTPETVRIVRTFPDIRSVVSVSSRYFASSRTAMA